MNAPFSGTDMQFFDVNAVDTKQISKYVVFQNACAVFRNFLVNIIVKVWVCLRDIL